MKTTIAFIACLTLSLVGCRRYPEPYCCTCIGHEMDIQDWRKERVAKLEAREGWLHLAGLYWLAEGENHLGSAPDNQAVFPEEAAPRIGTITVADGRMRFVAHTGVAATAAGVSISAIDMLHDADPAKPATRIDVGRFRFLVIKRGDRLALRLFDAEAEAFKHFRHLSYFRIDQLYRMFGRYVPFDQPRTLRVSTVIQTVEEVSVGGAVEFDHEGAKHRLVPMSESEDGELFFVFGDKTNGAESYGGGRFVYARKEDDGHVVLDFNKAYNPPCAFTPYATCPLPAKENRLPFAVRAGERKYKEHGGRGT